MTTILLFMETGAVVRVRKNEKSRILHEYYVTVTVYSCGFFFNCTTVDQASASMTPLA